MKVSCCILPLTVCVAVLAGAPLGVYADPVSKIAFLSDREGNWDVWVMNPDGTNQVNLTKDPSADGYGPPAWSPDGSKIAFATTRTGSWEIYTMNADGSNPLNITHNGANNLEPDWSPDGSKIVFTSNVDIPDDLYVVDAAGSAAPVRLTYRGSYNSGADWSPDGTRIVWNTWVSTIGGGANRDIWVMNADGSNQGPVLTRDEDDVQPEWCPDGSEIAFASYYPDGYYGVFVMNADGTDLTRLTPTSMDALYPTWSPDGSQIAFCAKLTNHGDTSQTFEIYVMNADGSDPTRITNNSWNDFCPAWSPDLVPVPEPLSVSFLSSAFIGVVGCRVRRRRRRNA